MADEASAHALAVEEVAQPVRGRPGGRPQRGGGFRSPPSHRPNILERARRPPYAQIAIRQVKDPLVGLLIVAASVSAAVGESLDAGIIAAIVLLNGALGFFEELGAERAIIALRESVPLEASVVRAGTERVIPAEAVVQGDLLVVREGVRVPADGRLVSGEGVSADEAPLTGESVPVEKSTAPVALATPLAERSAMVFAGTAITRGQGRVLVTAVGPATEMGRIARLTSAAKPPPTPLQKRIGGLARITAADRRGHHVRARRGNARAGIAASRSVPGRCFRSGCRRAGRPCGDSDHRARVRRPRDGETWRDRSPPRSRRDARERDGGRDRQDRHAHREHACSLPRSTPSPASRKAGFSRAALLASTARLVDVHGSVEIVGDPIDAALLQAALSRGVPRSKSPVRRHSPATRSHSIRADGE